MNDLWNEVGQPRQPAIVSTYSPIQSISFVVLQHDCGKQKVETFYQQKISW